MSQAPVDILRYTKYQQISQIWEAQIDQSARSGGNLVSSPLERERSDYNYVHFASRHSLTIVYKRRNYLTIDEKKLFDDCTQERKILKPRSGEKISGHWRDLIRRHRKKNMFISHTQNIAQWAQSIELSLQLKMVTNSIWSNSVQESKVLKKSKSREESRKINIWR